MNTSQITAGRRLVDVECGRRVGGAGPLAAVWRTVLCWQTRAAQRAHLAALDEHMRRDIGVSDAEVDQEVRKPFWMA